MVQVFRALRLSSPETFFTAVTILDKYFIAKWHEKISVGPESLYLLGMTSVLLSSKAEDVEAIRLRTLVEKAGHNRFTNEMIITAEFDILQALRFRILSIDSSVYHEVSMLYKAAILEAERLSGHMIRSPKDGTYISKSAQSTSDLIAEGEKYMTFIC